MSDKKKILVIDDDPDITDSVKVILESNGFDVITAQDGASGIKAVDENDPDLILCDMMMEQVDSGSKVTEEIKGKKPDLPIYLLSSIGQATASNVEIEKLGFKGVFQKPVSPDQLVYMVKKTLGLS